MANIKTSVLFVSGKPNMVMMDYAVDSSNEYKENVISEDTVR